MEIALCALCPFIPPSTPSVALHSLSASLPASIPLSILFSQELEAMAMVRACCIRSWSGPAGSGQGLLLVLVLVESPQVLQVPHDVGMPLVVHVWHPHATNATDHHHQPSCTTQQ